MCRVPGITKPGGSTKACVSLQDIYPTLLDLCDIPKPVHVDGKSLAPILKSPKANWESTAISYLYDRYASIRTEQFRYIRYQDGQQELYDHEQDPHEWQNEADNPKYAETLKELNSKLPAIEDMAKQLVRGKKR
jgi:arylsulfatase A-like enzyme